MMNEDLLKKFAAGAKRALAAPPSADGPPPPSPAAAKPKASRPRRGAIPDPPECAPDPSDRLTPDVECDPGHRDPARHPPAGSLRADPGPCPIEPLGYYAGKYYFFDVNGHYVTLSARGLGQKPELAGLFGAGDGWAAARFPQFDREGEVIPGRFSVNDTGRHLVIECHRRGLFNATMPMRGLGVWNADGIVAVHVGDHVLWPGMDGKPDKTQRAGFRARGALWPALPPVAPPAAPADAPTAQLVERAFQQWRWSQPEEWRVMTGLWAAGLLGAAIRWRAHGLVVGPPGSGKSTVIDLYGALSPLSEASNDFSEAGLRQLLSNRAAPLLLDEAEEDGTKLQRVVMLLRKASGGKGAQSVRGTGDGTAMQFTFTSPALMGSVLPPSLMPQDATRITRVDVLPIPKDAPPLPVGEMMAWAAENAHALWGRALAGISRFNANLIVVKTVLMDRGCSPRLADQVGTIIAARAMMMEDEPLDDYAAQADVDALQWLAVATAHQVDDTGPMSCLMHLMSSSSDVNSAGERPSIGTLVYRARSADGDQARLQLIEHGLMIAPYPRKTFNQFLYVANKHSRLSRVFDGTQWQNARWKEDLRHLADTIEPPDPQWFAGRHKSRCVLIPECLLPGADRETTPAPPGTEDDPGAWQSGDPGAGT
jgi:hypothetical protein